MLISGSASQRLRKGQPNMDSSREVRLNFVVAGKENSTIRQTLQLQSLLAELMQTQLAQDGVELELPVVTRSVDPITVGSFALILLPVVVDKVTDLPIDRVRRHKGSTVTIRIPTLNGQSLEISYNPEKISPEELREWLETAVTLAQNKST